MAQTKIVLDRQAESRVFTFGTTSASGEGLVTINNGTAATSNVVLDVKGSQNISGDLNLTGNLNITGSVNTQSVTNTNIQDITITLNDGGSTASAAGGGIVMEGDTGAAIGKILFDNTLTSKWKLGDGTTQVEVVTTSGAQTLTNKTIGGGQITGNITGNAANVTGTVAVANGGTGATTLTGYVKGTGTTAMTASSTIPTSDLTGTLGVANGGTGATSLTANNVILGNGTSAVQFVAPGASGNVLTSNGTTWVSSAPTGSSAYSRWTTVSGTQDGSNKTFTIGNALNSGSEIVVVNGVVLDSGASNDYVISGTTLTFQAGFTAPVATDKIKVYGVY